MKRRGSPKTPSFALFQSFKAYIVAMDFIYDHLHEKISLKDCAGAAGLNPTYFSGLFKRETGQTPGEYLARRRVEAAGELLTLTDNSPATIGSYLAYSSYSHFIAAFKKSRGITPREYRRRYLRIHLSRGTSGVQ